MIGSERGIDDAVKDFLSSGVTGEFAPILEEDESEYGREFNHRYARTIALIEFPMLEELEGHAHPVTGEGEDAPKLTYEQRTSAVADPLKRMMKAAKEDYVAKRSDGEDPAVAFEASMTTARDLVQALVDGNYESSPVQTYVQGIGQALQEIQGQ